MAIEIDESRRPLLVVRFIGQLSDVEVEQYLTWLGQHVRSRREKMVAIFDTTRMRAAPGVHRKQQADWIVQHTEDLRRTSLGVAFVVRSLAVRGAITAILWAQPIPQPYTFATTFAEAETWAFEKLRAAGKAAPLPR